MSLNELAVLVYISLSDKLSWQPEPIAHLIGPSGTFIQSSLTLSLSLLNGRPRGQDKGVDTVDGNFQFRPPNPIVEEKEKYNNISISLLTCFSFNPRRPCCSTAVQSVLGLEAKRRLLIASSQACHPHRLALALVVCNSLSLSFSVCCIFIKDIDCRQLILKFHSCLTHTHLMANWRLALLVVVTRDTHESEEPFPSRQSDAAQGLARE